MPWVRKFYARGQVGPEGEQGPRGFPGLTNVPADPAFAEILQEPTSESAQAVAALLDAGYVVSEGTARKLTDITLSAYEALVASNAVDPQTFYAIIPDSETVFTSDSFSVDSTTMTARATDAAMGGSPRLWSDSPRMQVLGGKLRASDLASGGSTGVNMESVDYEVTFTVGDLPTAANGVWFQARSQASATSHVGGGFMAMLTLSGSNAVAQARRVGSAGYVDVAPYPEAVVNVGDTIGIRVYQRVIQWHVNGNVFYQIEDATAVLQPFQVRVGRFSATTAATGGSLDNFKVIHVTDIR